MSNAASAVRVALCLGVVACSDPFAGSPGSPTAPPDSAGELDSAPDSAEDTPPLAIESISGWVNDDDGRPLPGATVTLDAEATTTGPDGRFEFAHPGRASTLTVSMGGRRTVTRSLPARTANVRVGLYPVGLAQPLDAEKGGTLSAADGSTVTIAGGAAGDWGLAAVTLLPYALDRGGIQGLPAGLGSGDSLAVPVAAVELGFDGPGGAIVLDPPATLDLAIPGGIVVGASAKVFRLEGADWLEVGTATLDYTSPVSAVFTADRSGTYLVGEARSSGCLRFSVVDASGQPVEGADVRLSVRPTTAVDASWVGSSQSDQDGVACVAAPSGPVEAWATVERGAMPLFGHLLASGATGDADTCSCADGGTLQVLPGGCASGSVFGPSGDKLEGVAYVYGEGDPGTSDVEGKFVVFGRAGQTVDVRGPSGSGGTVTFVSGTTPADDTCSRIGNQQIQDVCVDLVATDGDGAPTGGLAVGNGERTEISAAAGEVCLEGPYGQQTYVADGVVGAQPISGSSTASVPRTGGTCETGACTDGGQVSLPAPGCIRGIVYDGDGRPRAGVTAFSSAYDRATTDGDGAFCMETGGSGRAAAWAEGYSVAWVDDSGPSTCDAECAEVALYPGAGTVPTIVYTTADAVTRIPAGGSAADILDRSMLWFGGVTDFDTHEDAELILTVHAAAVYRMDPDGAEFDAFASGNWASGRISPDGTRVALLGYGASNPSVTVFELDGTGATEIATSSMAQVGGLGWSFDSERIASTRKDGRVEVAPADGATASVIVSDDSCRYPTWFDDDLVAVSCDGDAYTIDADGGGASPFLVDPGVVERAWQVTEDGRVVYSLDAELHVCDRDGSSDVLLLVGSPGTEYRSVRWDASGTWLLVLVNDPVAGTDVFAIKDAPPYAVVDITGTPSIVETGADWGR